MAKLLQMRPFGTRLSLATPNKSQGRSMSNPTLSSYPITELKGVGPKVAEKLAKLGIRSVQDMLFSFTPALRRSRQNILNRTIECP